MRGFKFLQVFFIAMLLQVAIGFSFATTAPRDVIQNTVNELNTQLGSLKTKQGLTGQPLMNVIHSTLLPKADLRFMLRQILGPEWRTVQRANKQKALLAAFQNRLIVTYSAILKNYNHQKIRVFPLRGGLAANVVKRDGQDTVNIRTAVYGEGQPLDVVFSLVKTAMGWKVFDIIASGVSVVQSFSSQFRPFIRQNGVNALIGALKKTPPNQS